MLLHNVNWIHNLLASFSFVFLFVYEGPFFLLLKDRDRAWQQTSQEAADTLLLKYLFKYP